MRRIYTLLVSIASPLAFGVLLLRGLRDHGYWQGLGERFGGGRRLQGAQCVWLHAVSLGEVAAAAPIVRALRAREPGTPIVVTTSTPTGRSRARGLFGDGIDVRFLPYDMPGAVSRFLSNIQPKLAIVMETELWPNLFRECARRKLPLLLASARLSSRSVSRYRRFGALFRGVFTDNVVVAAQTHEDAERFRRIGADPARVHVIGNVKFDLELDPRGAEQARALRAQYLGGRPTWIAGSTHPGEDAQVLEAHAAVAARVPGALLILAPRHPQRFDGVAALLAQRHCRFVRRSAGVPVPADAGVLLLDSVGELAAFYACAEIAFVGGSLVPIGGHNLLEPAALGIPVLTGPSAGNGPEIAALLLREGGALGVVDAHGLGDAVIQLFDEPESRRRIGAVGRRIVAAHSGSVARLLELIATTASTQYVVL